MLAVTLRRIKQAPAESNGVPLGQSQSCDHYTRSQYGRAELSRRLSPRRPCCRYTTPAEAEAAGVEPPTEHGRPEGDRAQGGSPTSVKLRRLGSNQRRTCLTDTRNYQQLPLRNESVRRESNPNRHIGKVACNHYTADAFGLLSCQRALEDQVRIAPDVTTLRVSRRSTKRQIRSGTGGSRTHNVLIKSQVHCLSASIPFQ